MKYFNKIITIFLLIAFVSINGCGLTLSGNKDNLSIDSNPRGAQVYINGYYIMDTPFSVDLKSDEDYIVEFRKDGYLQRTKVVNSSVAGGYVILDFIFGFFPVIIDAATDGWYTLDDEYCYVTLEKTSDAEKRKKEQAENDERNRLNDLEIKRNNLSSSDRDSIASNILISQKELVKLEEKRDEALRKNNYYIVMANQVVANNTDKILLKNAYMNKALIANKRVNKFNNYIFSLKEKLNRYYNLVPELRK